MLLQIKELKEEIKKAKLHRLKEAEEKREEVYGRFRESERESNKPIIPNDNKKEPQKQSHAVSQAMNQIGKLIDNLPESVNNSTDKNEYPQKVYDKLSDPEFRRYLRLAYEEALGDFEDFSQDVLELGSKVKDYLHLLYVVGSYKD